MSSDGRIIVGALGLSPGILSWRGDEWPWNHRQYLPKIGRDCSLAHNEAGDNRRWQVYVRLTGASCRRVLGSAGTPNAGRILGRRLRRWPNIRTTLVGGSRWSYTAGCGQPGPRNKAITQSLKLIYNCLRPGHSPTNETIDGTMLGCLRRGRTPGSLTSGRGSPRRAEGCSS